MNDFCKKNVTNFTHAICDFSSKYISDMLFSNAYEIDTSDLMNLILSAHLSATATLMLRICKENKGMHTFVKNFLDDIVDFISNKDFINEVIVLSRPN